MKLNLVLVVSIWSSILLGVGNPFGRLGDESIKQIKTQSSGGLSLTGGSGFTPKPPKFLGENDFVTYIETPLGEEQYNVSRQRPFRTTDTKYSFGDEVYQGRTGAKYTLKESAPEQAYSEVPVFNIGDMTVLDKLSENLVAQFTPNFDYRDSWSVGTGWFGAALGYKSTGNRTGNTFSAAWAVATVMGQSTQLIGANIQTSRDTKNTTTTTDDRLNYWTNVFYLGQKTEVGNSSIPLGGEKTFDELPHTNQKFFQQEWQYFIGPVPVLIRASLAGKVSGGKPAVEFGQAAIGGNEIRFEGTVRPSASLVGQAEGVVGGFASIPDDLLPAFVKAVAEVKFIEGKVLGKAHGRSDKNGPCLYAGTETYKTMEAELYVRAKWNLLQIVWVESFVNTVCDNGYFTIPGCNAVKSIVKQATNLLTFDKTRQLMAHPGHDLGSERAWLDMKACTSELKPTVIRLCNDNVKDIYGAVMFWDNANQFWQSAGWYRLPPLGCMPVSLGNYQVSSAYVYAMYENFQVQWSDTNANVCVHDHQAFDINRADAAGSCIGTEFKRVGMRKIAVTPNEAVSHHFGATDLSKFDNTILELCNKTGHANIGTAVAYFDGDRKTTVKGWFNIGNNTCKRVDIGKAQGIVYTHAFDGATQWGRGTNWCISTNLASFEYPFNETMGCGTNGNELREFSTFYARKGVNVYNFTDIDQTTVRRLCNSPNETESIWSVVAYREKYPAPDNRVIEGENGWYEVKTGQCREYRRQTKADTMWVYARNSASKEWPKQDGSVGEKFCMHPTLKFDLTNIPDTGDCPEGMVPKYFFKNPGTTFASFVD